MSRFALFGLICLLAATAASAWDDTPGPREAAPDSQIREDTVDPKETARVLRGTGRPLPRRYTLLRRVAKSVNILPYIGLEILVRPVEAIVRTDEIYHVTRRLAQVMVWDVDPVDSRVSLRAGYESGYGMTILGLNVKSRDWFGTGLDYDMTGGFLSPDNNLFAVRFTRPWTKDRISFLNRFEHKDERAFYGIGPGSDDVKHVAHRYRQLHELSWRHLLRPGLAFGLTGYARDTDLDVADAADDHELMNDGFPADYDRAENSRYSGLELTLTRDTRDDGDFSGRGSLMHLVAGHNDARSGGDPSYGHYSLEVQGVRTIWRPGRSLVGRIFLEGLTVDDADALPFTEMGNLGGRDALRGFARDRFRDTHTLLMTLEYRYPVTYHVQGRLFGDWGMVGRGWDGITLDGMNWSAGLGLAMRLGAMPITVQTAVSEEGWQAYVGTAVLFSSKSRRLR